MARHIRTHTHKHNTTALCMPEKYRVQYYNHMAIPTKSHKNFLTVNTAQHCPQEHIYSKKVLVNSLRVKY